MSRDATSDDLPLSTYQRALVRKATADIRQSRQRQFHAFVCDYLQGLQIITDADVQSAIRHAAGRHGRPAC